MGEEHGNSVEIIATWFLNAIL